MKIAKIVLLMFVIAVVSCTKEEITTREYPRVLTDEVTGINTSGALFTGEVIFANVPIMDHGFLWSDRSNFIPSEADKISLGKKEGTGTFTAECDFSLKVNQIYYVRSFARSKDYVVYGDLMQFKSLGASAPVITRFYPSSATWTDTVTIIGKNFTAVKNNVSVKFNQQTAFVLKTTKDTLLVKVPVSLMTKQSTITMAMLGNEAKSTEKFLLKNPEIQSISPTTGGVGATVLIAGRYINSPGVEVFFDDVKASVISTDDGAITSKVPNGVRGGVIELKVVTGDGELFATTPFTSEGPVITGISPQNVAMGQELTINGEYFATDPSSNLVTFDGVFAQVVSASTNQLKVVVSGAARINPTIKIVTNSIMATYEGFRYAIPQITGFTITPNDLRTYQIEIQGNDFQNGVAVYIGDQQLTTMSLEPTKIMAALPGVLANHGDLIRIAFYGESRYSAERVSIPWGSLPMYPATISYPVVSFVYGGKSYVGLGQSTREFRSFNPADATWTTLVDYPGTPGTNLFSFVIGSKAYVGGSGDVMATTREAYEYDIINNSWRNVASLPFATGILSSFAINNEGYLIQSSATLSKLWKYDQINDGWISLGNCPAGLSAVSPSFVQSESAYIVGSYDVYQYNATTAMWNNLAAPSDVGVAAFTIGADSYVIAANNFYQFDRSNGSWIPKRFFYTQYPQQSVAFGVSGKGYYILGGQVFEYDPALD